MDKLTEVYRDLNEMGAHIFHGSYHLKGKCDSVCVSNGTLHGVFMDMEKIKTYSQELEAASHEWAHLDGGYLYALDASPWTKRKAEVKADRSQIRRIIPFDELAPLVRSGLQPWELAERFRVSEKMVKKAIDYYTGPCGLRFD